MPKTFLTNINMETNQIQNAAIHPLGTPPVSPAPVVGQVYTNNGHLYVYDGTNWNTWGAAGGNAFGRITVGSTNVDADNTSDTLTLVAGSNVTLTPNATNDSITIASTDTNSNAFGIVKVGTTDVAADSPTDTLTLVAGSNVTLTPDATNDKITIAAAGGNAFGRITVGSTNIDADTEGDALTITAGTGITLTPDATNDSLQIACSVTDTDTKVTQTATTTNSAYPVLLRASTGTSTSTDTSRFTAKIRANASTGKMTTDGGSHYHGFDGEVAVGDTDLVTGDKVAAAIASAIGSVAGPMRFKGTLGTGGTITSLPTATADNVGFTYKVITSGTYAGQAAKEGDMFIGTQLTDDPATYGWTWVPSGDEQGIPTGGATNQYLEYGGTSGTAAWESPVTDLTASGASSSTNLVTAKAVADAISAAGAGTIIPEQISRATFTIASGSRTGSVSIGSDKKVYAVTEIQGTHGVVTDWDYNNGTVTATLAANATADVEVNVLYFGNGTYPTATQADYVVEAGSDENWEWRKWNSGKLDCWGSFSHTLAMTEEAGNGWFTSAGLQETFPSGLFNVTPKICMMSVMTTSGGAVCGLELGGGLSTSKTQQFWAYRVESSATVNCWIYVDAKGTWK